MRIAKRLSVVGLFLAIPGLALAKGYGMAGCGLGSMVFGDQPGIVQALAATTNGLFATQTFGITTGTSNCTAGGAVAKAKERQAFVEVNYNQLSRDTARGSGEYLAAFSTLLGCNVSAQHELFIVSQAHHDQLFKTGATPVDVVNGFETMVSSDKDLSQACHVAL